MDQHKYLNQMFVLIQNERLNIINTQLMRISGCNFTKY